MCISFRTKAIADPGLGNEIAWMRWIRFELVAQLSHEDAQVVRFGRVGPPHFAQELSMSDHFARVLHQKNEELVGNRRQVDLAALHEYLALREIDAQFADREHGFFLLGTEVGGVPERYPQAGEELLHAERFGEIVVGSCVERVDLVPLAAPSR